VDGRRSRRAALASWIAAGAFVLVATSAASAQPNGGGPAPTYQRRGTFAEQDGGHRGGWNHHRPMPQYSSQTSAGSFQRPYPYHLDYYRAKWGGSYAPYFGNLYGSPNFFIGGGPFWGGVSPWGFNGYNGYNGFQGAGFNNQFGGWGSPGFIGPGFQGGSGWGGAPYGPFEGNVEMPVEAEVGP
jgi:hypothetical protein